MSKSIVKEALEIFDEDENADRSEYSLTVIDCKRPSDEANYLLLKGIKKKQAQKNRKNNQLSNLNCKARDFPSFEMLKCRVCSCCFYTRQTHKSI
jgi:hypothetical protein